MADHGEHPTVKLGADVLGVDPVPALKLALGEGGTVAGHAAAGQHGAHPGRRDPAGVPVTEPADGLTDRTDRGGDPAASSRTPPPPRCPT